MKFFEKYAIFEYSLQGHLSAMGWLWLTLIGLICASGAFIDTWLGWIALAASSLTIISLLVWDIRFRYRHTVQHGMAIIKEWVETAPSNDDFELRRSAVMGMGLVGALQAARINIDGTPMMGNSPFDINGNIFGITSYDTQIHDMGMPDTMNDTTWSGTDSFGGNSSTGI